MGSCLVIVGTGFSSSTLLQAIQEHKINVMFLVPYMLHALTSSSEFEKTDTSSIKTIQVGGDIITKDLYLKAVKSFPSSEIMISHGMTEGSGAFKWPIDGKSNNQDIPWHADIAPVGQVQVGTRLKIAGDDNQALSRNCIGELHLSGNGLICNYLDGVRPENFYNEGEVSWFKTGDTGIINDDDWVYILGRKKDIIKRAGIPISPAALESALDAFLQSQASVLAVKHDTLGQVPFAVIRDLRGCPKEQVMQHVIDLFGKEYALQGVATLNDLDMADFPVNATGKILKRDLEQPVTRFIQAELI